MVSRNLSMKLVVQPLLQYIMANSGFVLRSKFRSGEGLAACGNHTILLYGKQFSGLFVYSYNRKDAVTSFTDANSSRIISNK